MRKSKDISKYEIEWQVLRSSLKGKLNDDIETKLSKAECYFEKTFSSDRHERVLNWMEGLLMGFKATGKSPSLLVEQILYYKSMDNLRPALAIDIQQQEEVLDLFSDEEIVNLWTDLCKTNEKWLKKGYFHKECNAFLDWLYSRKKNILNKCRFSYNDLLSLRNNSRGVKNTHQFFF